MSIAKDIRKVYVVTVLCASGSETDHNWLSDIRVFTNEDEANKFAESQNEHWGTDAEVNECEVTQ